VVSAQRIIAPNDAGGEVVGDGISMGEMDGLGCRKQCIETCHTPISI
jgi:hypothetical protein